MCIGIVWFHIMKAEGIKGGATMLVDGFRVAEHIREQNPEYFSLLSRVSIPHQMTYKDEATYKMRRITFTTDDDNQLNTVYFNNTDRKPLDAISLSEAMEVLSCNADTAIKKMYQAQRYLHRMVFSEQFTCRVQLQPGRMILLNNHRVLHGRDEVVAGSRRLHGTQIGESEWLSKMKILEQKLA